MLSQIYDVEISDNPDYVFCSVFSRDFLRFKDSIRIFYTGECQIPDFNLYDYALGFDHISFGDRYMRFPYYLLYGKGVSRAADRGGIVDMKEKNGFCSFVYSNGNASKMRKELFDSISSYKKVSSGGRYLNNIGKLVESKEDFERKFKFSIACENYSYPGYTTEKIIEAFSAGIIPIYWGDPLIKETFNADAFLNVADYNSMDSLVDYIRKIDEDDKEYLDILRQPVFVNEDHEEYFRNEVIYFLRNIFEQEKSLACQKKPWL